MYFLTAVGSLHPTNLLLLERIAQAVAQHEGHWIACGDFNCTLSELAESGVASRLRAAIIVSSAFTCARGRCIDFFLVDEYSVPRVAEVMT